MTARNNQPGSAKGQGLDNTRQILQANFVAGAAQPVENPRQRGFASDEAWLLEGNEPIEAGFAWAIDRPEVARPDKDAGATGVRREGQGYGHAGVQAAGEGGG